MSVHDSMAQQHSNFNSTTSHDEATNTQRAGFAPPNVYADSYDIHDDQVTAASREEQGGMMSADYMPQEEVPDFEAKFRSNFYMPALNLKKDASAAKLLTADLTPYKNRTTEKK